MIILLLNNLESSQMKVFISENLAFHAIFEKTFDLEYLFIKLFIIKALTKFAVFLIGFKLLLSDLRP